MSDVETYLEDARRRVEAALAAALPPESEPPETLHRSMRYSVLSGGKRLRPLLCLSAAAAVGGHDEPALLPAVAVELLHTYTLIHDDLPCMDDDDLRRGRPTNHKVFGEAVAVLAGDALLTLAFETLASARPRAPATAGASALVAELARAAGSRGVVGGQAADIACMPETPPDREAIAFIHRHKTADLIVASVRLGALSAGAEDGTLQRLTDFALNLGLAFQALDDLLDAAAGRALEGPSCVHAYGLEGARTRAWELTADAVTALSEMGPAADPLRTLAEKMLNRKG